MDKAGDYVDERPQGKYQSQVDAAQDNGGTGRDMDRPVVAGLRRALRDGAPSQLGDGRLVATSAQSDDLTSGNGATL
ncbi:antitoxin [Streptomyces sp. NPDC101151]|uniref:antitoxin n=1 Tax=Streptomyces sp. NPDC101151 TaxID=3366115 RepID=UPI003818C4FD